MSTAPDLIIESLEHNIREAYEGTRTQARVKKSADAQELVVWTPVRNIARCPMNGAIGRLKDEGFHANLRLSQVPTKRLPGQALVPPKLAGFYIYEASVRIRRVLDPNDRDSMLELQTVLDHLQLLANPGKKRVKNLWD